MVLASGLKLNCNVVRTEYIPFMKTGSKFSELVEKKMIGTEGAVDYNK